MDKAFIRTAFGKMTLSSSELALIESVGHDTSKLYKLSPYTIWRIIRQELALCPISTSPLIPLDDMTQHLVPSQLLNEPPEFLSSFESVTIQS